MFTKITKMSKVATYCFEWYTRPGRLRKLRDYPRVLNLLVTEECNCRCKMCNIWERNTHCPFTPQDLRVALGDSLFKKLCHVGISGGEPTLRDDLSELCEAIIQSLPKLQTLSITTNGSNPEVLVDILPVVKKLCVSRNVCFTLNISVDGIGEVHENIRQHANLYSQVLRSIQSAREFGIKVQLQCTVSSDNVYGVEGVRFLAQQYGIDIIYRVATNISRLENQTKIRQVALSDDQKSFFADFLTSPATMNQTRMPGRKLFYKDLAKRLTTGGPRKAPCYFQCEGVMLSSVGELYNCSITTVSLGNVFKAKPCDLYFSEEAEIIRNSLISESCLNCLHDQSGAWSPLKLMEGVLINNHAASLLKKVRIAVRFFIEGYMLLYASRGLKSYGNFLPQAVGGRTTKKALLIGCYGGEHVGDTAILGGVLQRIERDFDIRIALIASSRPDRTRRWANSLKGCIDTEVISYDASCIDSTLPNCDYLVFAGGPLMDLPAVLVSHLKTAIKAKQNNIPIIIEGCGIGPFQFRLSRLIVQRLLEMAVHLRLRTQASVNEASQWKVSALLDRDPAFDYLDFRSVSAKSSVSVPESLGKLLLTTKKIVGINLRPLWRKYAKGFLAAQKIREIEERFLEEFSHALIHGQQGIRFIFFPMNPDQYGFSDLSIAYRLQERLPSDVDFKIWEYEPDVDDLLYFLSKTTACVTMRFHASIFSLSQGVPTIGIDYGVGQVSKVGDLFKELGLIDEVMSVDKFDSSWLQQKLLLIS